MKLTKRRAALAAGTVAVFALGAGSCDNKGLGDAPVGEQIEDERLIVVNADGFPNFSIVCDGHTAIYSHTREAAPFTVEDSKLCDGIPPDANGIQEGEVAPAGEG